MGPVESILRHSLGDEREKFNILTSFTHESWETGLCKTGHNFYSYFTKGLKPWNDSRPLPKNYRRLPSDFVPDIPFDIIFSQTKFGQFQALKPIADKLHLPIVCIEHTDVMPWWTEDQVKEMKKMKGVINVFITEYSRDRWGWGKDEAVVVRHGINTELFSPDEKIEKKQHILSVVNDWENRDYICGFSTWKKVTQGLPVHPVGDTKGFSLPSKSPEELVQFYRQSTVFVNTSLLSPLPTSLLEAMSCGLPVVSTKNCAIPEVVTHGYNGFLSNDEKELRKYCVELLNNPSLAKEMGNNARQTILQNFQEQRFIEDWKNIFYQAANTGFKG